MSANAPTLSYDALHHLPVEALRHYDNETIFALVEDGKSVAAETVAAGRALHGRWITGEDAVMFRARRAARQLMAGAVMVCAASGAMADDWSGKDKAMHAQAGALIGVIATAATSSAMDGCLVSAGAGVAKEAYDATRPGHTPSVKDALVTAAAGCIASGVTGLVILPGRIEFRMEW